MMNTPDDPSAVLVKVASSCLRHDMSETVNAITGWDNWIETAKRVRHWPTHNELALNFIERHGADFRRAHPLRIPFIPSMIGLS